MRLIKIWNLKNGKLELAEKINAHAHYVTDIVELSDGSLASCSTDETIKIWQNNIELDIHKEVDFR